MKIYNRIEDFTAHFSGKYIAATIGFFDGVHKGHRKLLEAVKKKAAETGGESLVITFDKHPIAVLRPEEKLPVVLSSLRSKIRLIGSVEIDHLLVLPFTRELAAVEAHEFIAPLIQAGLTHLIMGYDNRFGRRSDMSLEDYDKYISSWGIEISRITPLLIDEGIVSSSAIRRAVLECDFPKVEKYLGRPYSFRGTVNHGRKIGRTIAYPTANVDPIDPHIFLPSVGIYIAEVRIDDKIYKAMAYYGGRPTIEDTVGQLSLEAYIIGFSGDLYGKEIEIGFRYFLREDRKFDSIEALAVQLKEDERQTLDYFATHSLSMTVPDEANILDLRHQE